MQIINKTLIFLFLIGFCTLALGDIVLMEEDGAIGMHAGFVNDFSFLDEEENNSDVKEGEDGKNGSGNTNTQDIKNGSKDANAQGLKNGGKSDVVNDSPQNRSDGNSQTDTQGNEKNGSGNTNTHGIKNGSKDANSHWIKNGGKSDVINYSPQNGSDENSQTDAQGNGKNGSGNTNTHGIKNGGKSDVVNYSPQNGSDGNSQVNDKIPDPKNPNTAALINEWISIAKPTINATECANTRYEAWGRAVGSTKTTTLQASGKPDNSGGRSSAEYLWSIRNQLDSVDHCTLGEYVTAKLENRSIAHCKGRYKAKGPKANEVLGEGRQYWSQGKLGHAIEYVSKEQKHVCDDQKVKKALSAMKRQKSDIDKKLQKTTSLIDNEKLDEAERSLGKAAHISTKYQRYVDVKQALEDARKKRKEDKRAEREKQVAEQAQQNADAREEARAEAQREADAERHAQEQAQQEAENQRHLHERAEIARQRAREQAQKNALARENARIKKAEEIRQKKIEAEKKRIARKKALAEKKRAQRKAAAIRRAQRKADAIKRTQRKAQRDRNVRDQRDRNARAQRDAAIRRNAQIKSQRDTAAFMNTMMMMQNNINARKHNNPVPNTYTKPTRTYTPTRTTHTHAYKPSKSKGRCGRKISKGELSSLLSNYKNTVRRQWQPTGLVIWSTGMFSINIGLGRYINQDRYSANVEIWKKKVNCYTRCFQSAPAKKGRTSKDVERFRTCTSRCSRMRYKSCP